MRKTLAAPAVVSGIGLHTGVPATMTFKPADNGITFLRTYIPHATPILAQVNSVSSTLRGTNLRVFASRRRFQIAWWDSLIFGF